MAITAHSAELGSHIPTRLSTWRRTVAIAMVTAFGLLGVLPAAEASARTSYDPVLHATGVIDCENWLSGERIVRVGSATMRGLESRQTAVRWRARILWSYTGSDWSLLKQTVWRTRLLEPGQSAKFGRRSVGVTGITQRTFIKVVYQFQWGTVTGDDKFGTLLYNRKLSANSYWTRFYTTSPIIPGPVPFADPVWDNGSCGFLTQNG